MPIALLFQIDAQVPSVQSFDRLAGVDRYATSAVVADEFPVLGTSTAYIATGSNFPDALAGGPAAATKDTVGAPLVLSRRGCMPAIVRIALNELGITTVKLLGGTGVLSDDVTTNVCPVTISP